MPIYKINRWLEPVGLLLLLFAFGWQCLEEHTNQMKIEAYFYEMNEKMIAIWEGIYDEALHSERYDGSKMISVNYDSINENIKDWGQMKNGFSTINRQGNIFFVTRVVLYITGSIFVFLSKCLKIISTTRNHIKANALKMGMDIKEV